MAVDRVLFIHGYSETSLGAYFDFPKILNDAGIGVQQIALSAFNSLDDEVTIDDLAAALADHVSDLEATGWNLSNSGVICHSTGALVARRWLLNRRAENPGSSIPSHLITMAGANHGSTLAQVGKSLLGYVQKIIQKRIMSVGARVLTDLDYGSDFLLRLNDEWLIAQNDETLKDLYSFSMGGDFIGNDPAMNFIWQTHEFGCDNTVRISGANLNYRILRADPDAGTITHAQPPVAVPHLILPGYSHFGPDTGILGNVHASTDPPAAAVLEALAVQGADDYAALAAKWGAVTNAWTEDRTDDANATLLFALSDRGGRSIDDCFIGFLDLQTSNADVIQALATSSDAILRHSPIQNNVALGSYSFYLNWAKYRLVQHQVHIEAHSPSELITYKPVDYQPTPEVGKLIEPNQFTYVKVKMGRDTDQIYMLYDLALTPDLAAVSWLPMPFPKAGQIRSAMN
jgi:alpha-beta hydrolase superfamily lysophospholipase